MPRSAALMLTKGLIIFSALSLYYLFKMLLDFPNNENSLWSPAFATAIFVLLATNFFTPCLVQVKLGAGSLVLELLAEMDGWAWVSALQEAMIVPGGKPDAKFLTALKFIGFYLLSSPVYLFVNSLLRDRIQVSSELERKLATFDSSIFGYVLGFALQVLIGAVVFQLITKGDTSKEYYCFSLEVFLVAVAVYYLEKLRTRASTFSKKTSAILTLGVDVVERALSVSLGFAWLHAFKPLYESIVYKPLGENYEADDATWLVVSSEGEDEYSNDQYSRMLTEEGDKSGDDTEDGEVGFSREQARRGLVWLLLLFIWVVLLHSSLEASAKRQKMKEGQENQDAELVVSDLNVLRTRIEKRQNIKDFMRTEKRMKSLAFGFAIEKTLGDLFLHGFG